jgi:hypothetical protein
MTAHNSLTQRPALRLVEGELREPGLEWSWFCGHCALPPADEEPPSPWARVCPSCGLGLLIETPGHMAPTGRDAFLIVDDALLVQALSRRAESLLCVREELVVMRPLTELLVPADVEGQSAEAVAEALVEASSGDESPRHVYVRPSNTFGVRIRARVAPCGPPRAALLVFEPGKITRLRAVAGTPSAVELAD